MRLSSCLVLILGLVLYAGGSAAADYNYISATELEARLSDGVPMHIVDIQVPEDFAKRHIKGATPTYAYPVETDADKAKLAVVLERLKRDSDLIVIVCPRGAGSATRTYDYLVAQGIAPARLLILEKGLSGWSCVPLTEGK